MFYRVRNPNKYLSLNEDVILSFKTFIPGITKNYSFAICSLCVCQLLNASYAYVDFAFAICQTNNA